MRDMRSLRPATWLLTAMLLAGCANPSPTETVPIHDEGDHMFLMLASIARRPTMPTERDQTVLMQAMTKIRRGNDACAQWKLDQIIAIGLPLVMDAMNSDAATQHRAKLEARQQLHDASGRLVPDVCHGNGFPPVSFDPGQS